MRHYLIYINNLTTSFSNQQMRQHILPSGAARVRTPGPLILGAQRGLASAPSCFPFPWDYNRYRRHTGTYFIRVFKYS